MKRRLFKLGLFLLLGAVVNVAVAWGCQLKYEPFSLRVDDQFQFQGWNIWIWRALGAQGMFHASGYSPEYIARLEQWKPPAWSRLRELPIYEKPYPAAVQADRAFGLPVLSVWYGLVADRASGSSLASSRERTGWLPYRDLAMTPIWPGFAINTIFYAAILWLLAFGPFAVHRFIRDKRGRCIKCGYDLRGDFSAGCSECGWRREDVP